MKRIMISAMQSGSEEPHSLRLYVSGTTDGYVHDQQLMHEFWDELCAVRIDVDHPVSAVIDDGYLSFSFDWNTELIPFPFCTSEYAQFSEGELFPVENPDAVQSLVARLSDLIEEGQTDDELPFEDGAYLWDADGDGTRERVTVSAVDNGDEAPNVLVIRVYGDTMDVEGVIERAYGIEGIRAASDEAGPYLTLHYLEGDYYAHDHIATCMLRVAGDKLVVE